MASRFTPGALRTLRLVLPPEGSERNRLLGSMLGGRASAQTVAVTVGFDSDCDYQDLAQAVADVEGLTAAERLIKVRLRPRRGSP